MSLLIENANVLGPDGWRPGRSWVHVDGTAIAGVGDMGQPAPHASESVDIGGQWLIPGLINSHTHITIDETDLATPRRYYPRGEIAGILDAVARGRRCLEAGITGLRDCNSPGTGGVALRDAFARSVVPGPRMWVSGRAITATGGHMHSISVEADGPDGVRTGVRAQIRDGADFIKLVAEAASSGGAFVRPSLQLTVEEMTAGVDAAHRLGRRVTVHAVSRHGVQGAVDAGADSIEHGYDIPDELLAIMAERGVWLVPTLSVHGAISTRGQDAGYSADRVESSRRILERALDTVRRALGAGVRIACGSDAGSPLNPVWELIPELALLTDAGMNTTDAIQAATSGSAALLGVASRVGSVAAGMVADLVVVDRDPAANVGALNDVVAVLKDGVRVAGRLANPAVGEGGNT
jgi:imidazolonepropionase-like amidohydrolase